MARTITVRDFVGLLDKLPPKIEAACVRGLRSAALRGVGEIVDQIDEAEPYPAVDTGMLRQSARAEDIHEGAQLSVDAPQAAWMEFGTRPHMPPLGPILTWARRKFQLGERRRKGSRKAGPKPPPKHGPKAPPMQGPKGPPKQGPRRTKMQRIAQNEKLAYAIAKKVQWKIYHYGTEPRGFFSKAMNVIVTKYAPREVRHELKQLEKSL